MKDVLAKREIKIVEHLVLTWGWRAILTKSGRDKGVNRRNFGSLIMSKQFGILYWQIQVVYFQVIFVFEIG